VKPSRLLIWFAVVTISACGGSPTSPEDGDGGGGGAGDPEPGFNNTTTFHGVIAGRDGRSGIIEITIQALISSGAATSSIQALHTDPDEVSGTLTPNENGGRVPLLGQHDHSAGRVTFMGGGYSFDGVIRPNGVLSGDYTGPDQGGGFSMLDSGTSFLTSYCGTFRGDEPDDRGTWSVVMPSSSGAIAGSAVQDGSGDCIGAFPLCPPISGGPDVIQIEGSLSGNSVEFSFVGIGGGGNGSFSGGTVSGDWRDSSGETGTFSSSTVGCQ
jgi:hypothetical protein